jgi:glycogen synthase
MSGCALVLGDIPSLRENWDRAARFVPPEDTDALRLAVAELADDSVQRETLAEAALERSSQFRLEGIAKEYLSAYDELSVASHQLLRSAS